MWDRLKECPVLDQLLPAPMWWKMSTGVKTLSREQLCWTSDSQIAKTSHLTIEGMSSGHCPVGAAAGVGKRPRKSKLLHASYLSTVQPLLSTALLLSTVLPSVRVCARGFRRCCSSSPTPASPPRVLRTPATMFPPAIKPFPTTVGSSVTKTAPANIVRTPSTMAVLILLGELSPTCAVSSKFPTWKFPESVNYSYYGAEECMKSDMTWKVVIMAQEDNYGKLDRPNSPIKRTTKTLRKSLQKNQHGGEKMELFSHCM